MDPHMLNTLSHKLGITTPKTTRKAEELMRLMSVQGGGGLSLTMSAKAVICLEMAAALTNCTVDKTLAVKLSGMKRPQYVATSQTVSRLLNVSPSVSISDLCVTHSATAAKDLAAKVLQQYEVENKQKGQVDTDLPVYQTAAVFAACKVMKIKVDKRRMFESSRSKRAVYDKVVEMMTKIAESMNAKKNAKAGSKRTKTLLEMVEEDLQNSPEKKAKTKNDEDNKETEADFDEWKRKILEAAAAAE